MAEYVDRLKLLTKVKTEYIEDADLGYDYYDYLLQTDLMDIEPADVVERSKIENAILEIQAQSYCVEVNEHRRLVVNLNDVVNILTEIQEI